MNAEADAILAAARRQAEQITSNATARAESLERDAGERHRRAMGSLVQSREELDRRVEDLRAFEREYRSRLRAYLQGLLRDLDGSKPDCRDMEQVTVSRADLQWALQYMSVDGDHTRAVKDRLTAEATS